MDNVDNKKAKILNAMEKLIINGKGLSASVSEIAKAAGIGKGSIYYYFKSKEEIADALILRMYGKFIDNCKSVLSAPLNAVEKLKLLFKTYYSQSINLTIDTYLHLPQNIALHQKSLTFIVLNMSPIISKILEQGNKENSLKCDAPNEYAHFILTVLTFLFDYGIFEQNPIDTHNKLKAFSELLEKSLDLEKGSFSFLYGPKNRDIA